MFKKLLALLGRDLLSSRRDFLLLYIIVFPVIAAVVIQFFAPGLNDVTTRIALLENDKEEHISFLEKYAKVELFPNMAELERRIMKRDEIAGIVPLKEGAYEILLQGNESEGARRAASYLNALYELGARKEDTTAELLDFGHPVHPLKSKLVNMLILMTIMLTGMLIALGIVEEKQDNTISAINVTPVSKTMFIAGKSLIGGITALAGIVLSLLITGYYDINWFLLLLVGFSSMILTMAMGFVQGLDSDDIIEAAANVKMLMLPIAGSVAVYELVSDKWQWTMYWCPFYWAYRVNDMILTKNVVMGQALFFTALVFVLSSGVYILYLPKIRKGLS